MKKVLRIFVYGTLKRGYNNHPRLAGAESIINGHAVGDLYDLGSFPMLHIPPPGRILGQSRKILSEDLEALDNWAEMLKRKPNLQAFVRGAAVYGELATFSGTEEFLQGVLNGLDSLEGFSGDPATSFYNRVILPVGTSLGVLPAWTYVKIGCRPEGLFLPRGIWTGDGHKREFYTENEYANRS